MPPRGRPEGKSAAQPASAPREKIFNDLRVSGEYSDHVHHDETDELVYFAPPGTKVPHGRSDYITGTGIAVLLVVLWIVLAIAAFVLQAVVDGFNGELLGFVLPVGLLTVFALAAPFLRRRNSAEGRLFDALRRGDIIAMRATALPLELVPHAACGRDRYYENAVELARADALRSQAEQMRELRSASSVAGSHARRLDTDLAAYAERLEAAAAGRECTVKAYLERVRRG